MGTNRHSRNIYVMDADGGGQKQLTHTTMPGWWNNYPSWSPDGTKIAYTSGKTDREGYAQSSIFIMDHDGGNRGVLSIQACQPEWSPDGKRIVFGSKRDDNGEIYIIDADGKNLRRLTKNYYCDRVPCWLATRLWVQRGTQ